MRPFMRALAGTLGLEAIGDGVYRIGWITRDDRAPRQISDEATRYMRANPGYRLGHGLFTVIPVSMGRVMRAGLSVLAAGELFDNQGDFAQGGETDDPDVALLLDRIAARIGGGIVDGRHPVRRAVAV